ncbi:MAG: hypothetical protein Q8Q73_19455 [Stagnimonas sp.]|nr:hypothetical protein [Stagnimonas sp.]
MPCNKAVVARQIVERLFRDPGIDRDIRIRQYVDTKKERVYLTHVLNGPLATWITEHTECRWVTIKQEELEPVVTAGDLMDLCEEHLV